MSVVKLLSNCLELLSSTEQRVLSECLKKAKDYMKARYKLHCESDSDCPSHCASHALSHPIDQQLKSECTKKHSHVCQECYNVKETIKNIETAVNQLPDSRNKVLALHDIHTAETKIMDWKRHIIRGMQQGKARDAGLKNLKENEAMWIRDYAQKVNPSKVCYKTVVIIINNL